MKKLHKFAAFMLIAMLVLSACGQSKQAAPEETAKPAAGQDQAAPSPTPEPKKEEKKVIKLGITQIVEHPSLDAAQKGFLAALKDNGFIEGDNLEVDLQIAQGDMSNNASIAQKFAADKKDLILGISTPSTQAVVQQIKDTPILFTAITDPLGAKLVSSLEKPGGNVTGTSDTHPEAISKLMNFIASQFPKVKTIGIVANEGEQNSLINVKQAENALSKLNIKVVKSAVSNSSEVKQGAESLVGRCDAIYVPKDNTVVAALESVIQVAEQNKIPLFVGEKDSVKRGGFASYGFEYYDLGYTTGKMAAEILKNGKNPGDIPVGFPENLDLAINMKAAKNEGIEVTDAMKSMVKDPKDIIE